MTATGWLSRLPRVPVRTRVAAAFALGSIAVSSVLGLATWNLATGYMLRRRTLHEQA